ncbi:hypothetical protein [Streptomyces similanensis]|uniref:Lipoprotein n=1 Tax=Streptomyces similanensis TaxID=1274988 RepID=A0ABP9K8H0_9ACTN
MPLPPSPRALSWGPRRRSLLASAAGAALLAGCSAGADDPGAADRGPSPAERARTRAAEDSAGLARRYDAVIAAHPALAERLRPLRAEVLRHAAAFGGAAPSPSPTGSPSGTATGSPAAPAGPTATGGATAPASSTATATATGGETAPGGATATGGAAATDGPGAAGASSGGPSKGPSGAASPAVPVKPADALAALAAAERALADARAAALLDVPGELARLLASVAAAGAAHAYLLTEGEK